MSLLLLFLYAERSRRQTASGFKNLTICDPNEYVTANACGNSDQWLWECQVNFGANCIYLCVLWTLLTSSFRVRKFYIYTAASYAVTQSVRGKNLPYNLFQHHKM